METFFVNPLWKEQTAYIIGGGPSLKNIDLSFLEKKNVIATNFGFEKVLPKYLLVGDNDIFRQCPDLGQTLKNLEKKGVNIITFSDTVAKRLDFKYMKKTASYGLCKEPGCISWNIPKTDTTPYIDGGNTGAGAINFAYFLGIKSIFLLGFDMHKIANNNNFHTHYTVKTNEQKIAKHRKQVELICKDLRTIGIKVFDVRLSSDIDSHLRYTTHINFEDFLEVKGAYNGS